jgi:chromosome segregation ATPase
VEPGSIVAIAIASITLLGTVTAARIQRKLRGPSDARDDKTAENATLKSAAEVAMELVDKMKLGSEHVQQTMVQQIQSLQQTIDIQKDIINELRQSVSRGSEEATRAAAAIQRLESEVSRLTDERNRLARELDELRHTEIAEITLSAEAVRKHRDAQPQQ